MKIVHKNSGNVIAEETAGKLIVHNENFKNEWEISGIAIPHFMKNQYGGASVVKLGDKNFKKALVEVYYELNMNHDNFTLEK